MLTSIQLIELAKAHLAVRHLLTLPMSDYRLAQLLDIPDRTVSNWRVGRSHIGTKFAKRFADATGLAEEYVYACIEHERADTEDARSILEKIAEHYAHVGTAASVLLATFLLFLSPHSAEAASIHAAHVSSVNPTLYTLCALRDDARHAANAALRLLVSLILPGHSRLAC